MVVAQNLVGDLKVDPSRLGRSVKREVMGECRRLHSVGLAVDTLLMPRFQALGMEAEGAVGNVDLIFQLDGGDGVVAAVTRAPVPVAHPDLSGRVLRQGPRPSRDLCSDVRGGHASASTLIL